MKIPRGFIASGIHFRNCICDPANRKPQTAGRMDPRHTHDTRLDADAFANAVYDLVGRDRAKRIEKGDLAPRRAAATGRQADGLMMDVVIVGGRKHFVALTKRQSVIDERETGGRVLGERDILRVAADVTGNGPARFQRHIFLRTLEERGLHRHEWICIELAAIFLDCFANRTRMRGQIEKAKMSVVGRKIELPAHCSPIVVTGGGCLCLFGMCQ